jgi:hypothetical protein
LDLFLSLEEITAMENSDNVAMENSDNVPISDNAPPSANASLSANALRMKRRREERNADPELKKEQQKIDKARNQRASEKKQREAAAAQAAEAASATAPVLVADAAIEAVVESESELVREAWLFEDEDDMTGCLL